MQICDESRSFLSQVQYLTCLSLELHTHTRGNLRPDPEFDPILAVCYYVHHDWPRADGAAGPNSQLGVIAIDIDNCGFTSFVGKTALATPTKGNSATPLKGTGATPKKKDATPTKVPPADDGASASTAGAATPPKVSLTCPTSSKYFAVENFFTVCCPSCKAEMCTPRIFSINS